MRPADPDSLPGWEGGFAQIWPLDKPKGPRRAARKLATRHGPRGHPLKRLGFRRRFALGNHARNVRPAMSRNVLPDDPGDECRTRGHTNAGVRLPENIERLDLLIIQRGRNATIADLGARQLGPRTGLCSFIRINFRNILIRFRHEISLFS